jgi:hypothetical protein
MMTTDRYNFLMLDVFGTDNAKEILNYFRDEYLSQQHRPNFPMSNGENIHIASDPNGLDSIRDMAVLEFIQTLISFKENYDESQALETEDSNDV